MAKGDKKTKKSKDKVKIPKRVAGVEVSKAVRQAAKTARKLAEQPVVSETVAAALLAAAAALRGPPATKRVAGAAGQEANRLSDSLRKLAIETARRTLEAWEAADSKPRGNGGAGSETGPERR